jgi:hypothetical protein
LTGNRCAFSGCTTRLVDRATGSVVGEVCHIKGEKPTAPRYDAAQTDLERHGFDNLIVLCNVHHKVVDDNKQDYPVERLRKMKSDHEGRLDGKEPLDEQASEAFASAVTVYFVQHGSVIQTTNQTGGQVAHSITNTYVMPVVGQLGRTKVAGDPQLPQQAVQMLRDAANGDGTILVLHADAGLAVLVNGKQANEMGNPRSEALYRDIVESLRSAGLITLTQTSGSYAEVYKLTSGAYHLVDAMK